jgi:DNA-binding CsgD family transcriptional regulator
MGETTADRTRLLTRPSPAGHGPNPGRAPENAQLVLVDRPADGAEPLVLRAYAPGPPRGKREIGEEAAMQRLPAGAQGPERQDGVRSLSERDHELLRHLAGGMSTAQIASAMSVSNNTVRTRVHRVLAKLAVTERSEAVRRARDLGIVDP